MTPTSDTLKASIQRDGPEVARSFAAGAAYMVAVVAFGAVAVTGAAGLSRTALPQLVEAFAPSKFPKYSAHDMSRADRWNPDRWDTEIAGEHGNHDNASKVAVVVEDPAQLR